MGLSVIGSFAGMALLVADQTEMLRFVVLLAEVSGEKSRRDDKNGSQ